MTFVENAEKIFHHASATFVLWVIVIPADHLCATFFAVNLNSSPYFIRTNCSYRYPNTSKFMYNREIIFLKFKKALNCF